MISFNLMQQALNDGMTPKAYKNFQAFSKFSDGIPDMYSLHGSSITTNLAIGCINFKRKFQPIF